jgi:hypothetical protein
MKPILSACVAAIAILIATGCSTRPVGYRDADPAQIAGVGTVRLLPITPLVPRAERLSRYGSGLGFAGRALDAAVDSGDNARYAALLARDEVALTRRLVEGLDRELAERDLALAIDPAQQYDDDRRGAGASIAGRVAGGAARALADDGLRDALAAVDADAQLEIAVRYIGWLGAGSNTPLRPTIQLTARLADREGRREWWRQSLAYHEIEVPADALVLDPPAACAYPDLDAIEADAATARACLETALDESIERLVTSLAGGGA